MNLTPAEQVLADAAAAAWRAKYLRAVQSMAEILYNADPVCVHEIVDGDNLSGVKCAKCPGWHCA